MQRATGADGALQRHTSYCMVSSRKPLVHRFGMVYSGNGYSGMLYYTWDGVKVEAVGGDNLYYYGPYQSIPPALQAIANEIRIQYDRSDWGRCKDSTVVYLGHYATVSVIRRVIVQYRPLYLENEALCVKYRATRKPVRDRIMDFTTVILLYSDGTYRCQPIRYQWQCRRNTFDYTASPSMVVDYYQPINADDFDHQRRGSAALTARRAAYRAFCDDITPELITALAQPLVSVAEFNARHQLRPEVPLSKFTGRY